MIICKPFKALIFQLPSTSQQRVTTCKVKPQSTYLEHVPGDDVKPLVVVGDSFEVRVVAKDHLEYLQEELKRVLVEEVDLCVCVNVRV